MAKSFNVSDFRGNFVGDGARPTLFGVNITSPVGALDGNALQFICSASHLPASSVSAKTISYYGHDVHLAGNRTFDDWSITVYNDENFKIRNSFEIWLDAIDRHSGAGRGQGLGVGPSEYVVDASVHQFGKNGDILKEYVFYNLWPSSIGQITVDWNSKDDIETFEVTMKFDWFHAVDASANIITS